MRAGYVIVRLRDNTPLGVIRAGVKPDEGSVYDSRAAADKNCEWANSPAGREILSMGPRDSAEVMEVNSITETENTTQ